MNRLTEINRIIYCNRKWQPTNQWWSHFIFRCSERRSNYLTSSKITRLTNEIGLTPRDGLAADPFICTMGYNICSAHSKPTNVTNPHNNQTKLLFITKTYIYWWTVRNAVNPKWNTQRLWCGLRLKSRKIFSLSSRTRDSINTCLPFNCTVLRSFSFLREKNK